MATYPTPPSSSGDSPQPIYFVASPGSNSFSSPQMHAQIIKTDIDMVDLADISLDRRPKLRFLEQPINKFRFRYKSEMAGTHGSLCGMNSDKSRKQTYPTVELQNCSEKAIVRCSIYQYKMPEDLRPHPHRLIMKRGREEHDDPHDIDVGPMEGFVATFHSMGIIHTARKNIVTELIRKKTQLQEEYVARMEERKRSLTTSEMLEIKRLAEQESKSINLNIVCLRFDAFIIKDGILRPICEPIYSHGINNLKCALTGDLKIVRLDHCTSPEKGGKEIFLLVERVTKKNIRIRFFELDDDDNEIWEAYGKFSELDVHHQYAIVFKTPPYTRVTNISQPVRVYMELVRPSDGAKSECKEFRYVPNNEFKPGSKRPRSSTYSSSYNSSSFSSSELPTTIAGILEAQPVPSLSEVTGNNSWNNGFILTQDQMTIAMNDVHSDEFDKLYRTIENLLPENFTSHVRDSPKAGPQMDTERIFHKPNGHIKIEFCPEDIQFADRTYSELNSFIKSTDARERAPVILQAYLGENKKTNALHVFTGQNRKEELTLLLKMIVLSKQKELTNVVSADLYSPLHIAVMSKNEEFVLYLLKCDADPAQVDGVGKNALHLAVESMATPKMLELLLTGPHSKKLANSENYDGETPLCTAIEKRNMTAVKVLCKYQADINRQNKKNGFTPLRMAIENGWADMVSFILDHPDFLLGIQNDFSNMSPFDVANKKDVSLDIRNMIADFMAKKGINIKQENDDDDENSDDEMEEDLEIKTESNDEPEFLYGDITKITPDCLDKVSSILDESGKCLHLADLLDLSHLITTGTIPRQPSLSKNLLMYATERDNVKVLDIRNFLENLDEDEAVQLLDQMAIKLRN